MALGLATRELELIIIASDHASATLARVGGGLTLLGAGMTRLAAEGLEAFSAMTGEALDFDRQARLAFTQVDDKAQTTLDDVKGVLRNVASEVGRPIEELQEGIFDIFSSIDANAETAEFALRKVGEAAVAGQTDVRSALIPTIATLNAFNEPLEEIDAVLDLQFKTVQKGIITYDELTAGIGKVIPAAVAAGQSQQQMGAIIAFLTRNGLNAQMAMTSAARAMELFADPKSQKNLQKAGIAIKDETGEFRQMNEVLTDLQVIFGDLTAPERKEKFKELFGTGRIQARRFFDIAIPQFDELNDLVNDFAGSSGAMQDAYDIMLEAPLSKLDILKNRWELLRIEIGDRFIPILEERLIPIIEMLFDRWDSLSEEQKDMIVQIAAMGTAALGVAGAFTTAAGVITLVSAIWGGFAKVAGVVGLAFAKAIAPVAVLAAVGYLLWKNWDKVIPILEGVRDKLLEVYYYLRPLIDATIEFIQTKWNEFVDKVKAAWDRLAPVITGLAEEMRDKWEATVNWWNDTAWPKIEGVVVQVFDTIKAVVEGTLSFLASVIEVGTTIILAIWDKFGNTIRTAWDVLWNVVTTVLENLLDKIHGLLVFAEGLFTGDWEKMKEGLLEIWNALWSTVTTILGGAWEVIKAFFSDLGGILSPIWENIWNNIKSFFQGIWQGIVDWFKNLWNSDVVVFIRNVVGIIYEIIRIGLLLIVAIWEQVWNGVQSFFSTIWDTIKTVAETAWNAIKVLAGAIWWLIGDAVMAVWDVVGPFLEGVWNGIKSVAETVWNAIKTAATTVWNGIADAFDISEKVGQGLSRLWDTVTGFFGDLWQGAQDWVGRIRETLSKIDPRTWFSPPITQTVGQGMNALSGVVTGGLSSLSNTLPDYITGVRNQFNNMVPDGREQLTKLQTMRDNFMTILGEIRSGSALDPLQAVGFSPGTTAGQILQAKALSESRQFTEPSSSGTTVNIETLNSNADPREIASEIAWNVITAGGN